MAESPIRECPYCGNAGERGRIAGVFNGFIDVELMVGAVLCSNCGCRWEEYVDRDRRSVEIGEFRRDDERVWLVLTSNGKAACTEESE